MSEMLRIPQVARELGISRAKAYQIAREDRSFPAVRLGPRLTLVPRAALAAWIAGLARPREEAPSR